MSKKRDDRPANAKLARELLDLIERDRPAAATALGVTLPSGPRAPVLTAPVAPQRARATNTNDTYPPPIAEARDQQRGIATDVARPLTTGGSEAAPKGVKAWMIAAGIGGVG